MRYKTLGALKKKIPPSEKRDICFYFGGDRQLFRPFESAQINGRPRGRETRRKRARTAGNFIDGLTSAPVTDKAREAAASIYGAVC